MPYIPFNRTLLESKLMISETGKFRKNEENYQAELIINENERSIQMWSTSQEFSARFFGTFASMAKVHQLNR